MLPGPVPAPRILWPGLENIKAPTGPFIDSNVPAGRTVRRTIEVNQPLSSRPVTRRSYSLRKATTGSTRAARIAGTAVATIAVTPRSAATAT